MGASLSLAWVVPFAGLLLSIAFLPMAAPTWWHRHFGKVALGWAVAFVVPFALAFGGDEALHRIAHAMLRDYLPFVILLSALYAVSGGIGLFGDLRGSPGMNTLLLAIGAVLASLMGTTGASLLLVRPLIRANAHRPHQVHVLVFFIFIVANAGGALTPLGDPPLFLGFLNGVTFFWTLHAMLGPTLVMCGVLLAIFHVLDRHLHAEAGDERPAATGARLRIEGRGNLLLMFAIVGAVLASASWRPGISYQVFGTSIALQDLVRDGILVGIVGLSMRITAPTIHAANGFNWGPMREVAKLFAAIFVTIIPLLAMLEAGDAGASAALRTAVTTSSGEPNAPMYFWLTGVLSAFLDNAPTYLVFFHLAGGDAQALMEQRDTLRAISCGAVFMGALTYIGNAPNFMVRAIAEEHGIAMPSFFGYMVWSVPVLVPLFVLLTFSFFR